MLVRGTQHDHTVNHTEISVPFEASFLLLRLIPSPPAPSLAFSADGSSSLSIGGMSQRRNQQAAK